MKKITFNRVIITLVCITYLITAILFILAFPLSGKDNQVYLDYTVIFGMIVPVILAAIFLICTIWTD